LWIWLLISLFPDKSPNYALPLYPMLSWIAAAGLCRLPWRKLRSWYDSEFKGLAPASVCLLIALSLSPIRFQEGPNKDWQSLFTWLKTHSIPANQLAALSLKPNDRAYFYIKTGSWLPEFQANGTNLSGLWLLTEHDPHESPESLHAPPDFVAGSL